MAQLTAKQRAAVSLLGPFLAGSIAGGLVVGAASAPPPTAITVHLAPGQVQQITVIADVPATPTPTPTAKPTPAPSSTPSPTPKPTPSPTPSPSPTPTPTPTPTPVTTLKLMNIVSGGTAAPSSWTLNAGNNTSSFSGPGPTVGPAVISAGAAYSLFQSGGPSGYTAGAWICTDPAGAGFSLTGSTIVVQIGRNVVCTVTDTAIVAVRPWPLPVVTGVFNVPVDSTGATDITAPLNIFLATVPDGSTVSFAAAGVYKISSQIDLRGHNNLIIEGNGATLNNVANANLGASESKSFFRTQAPGYLGAVSNHITIRNFRAFGANPTPGKLGNGEFAHFLTVYDGSYYELDNITASGLFGDLAMLNSNTQYIWIHNSHVIDVGRNGVSDVWASHVLIEKNAFDIVGYTAFDIEPEESSVLAHSTLTDIIFRDNTVGTWANSFMSGGAGTPGSMIDGVIISGNTVTGSSLVTVIPGTWTRSDGTVRRNFTITNNTSLKTAAGPVFRLAYIDGLTVTGNVQPLSSGSLISLTDCTAAVTSPNP